MLGPAQSGDKDEMRVKFADGTVDDWDTDDFVVRKELPKDLVKLQVSICSVYTS